MIFTWCTSTVVNRQFSHKTAGISLLVNELERHMTLQPVEFSAASFVWQSMEKMPEITVKHQLATESNLVSFQNANSEVIESTTVRTVRVRFV